MGITISILAMAMSMGMATGLLVSGLIADWVNIDSVFYFAAAMGLIGVSLFVWATR